MIKNKRKIFLSLTLATTLLGSALSLVGCNFNKSENATLENTNEVTKDNKLEVSEKKVEEKVLNNIEPSEEIKDVNKEEQVNNKPLSTEKREASHTITKENIKEDKSQNKTNDNENIEKSQPKKTDTTKNINENNKNVSNKSNSIVTGKNETSKTSNTIIENKKEANNTTSNKSENGDVSQVKNLFEDSLYTDYTLKDYKAKDDFYFDGESEAMLKYARSFFYGKISFNELRKNFLGKEIASGYKVTDVYIKAIKIPKDLDLDLAHEYVKNRGGFSGGNAQKQEEYVGCAGTTTGDVYFYRIVYQINR